MKSQLRLMFEDTTIAYLKTQRLDGESLSQVNERLILKLTELNKNDKNNTE